MRIFIMADIEGISGIYSWEQALCEGKLWPEARQLFTDDVIACVNGCREGGATSIVFRDCHAAGNSVLWEKLPAGIECQRGRFFTARMPEIETCDGLILLGYHAKVGTRGAMLAHTFNLDVWHDLLLNGRSVGEFGVDAGIAGDANVPTIMVSGDDKVCAEARELVPDIVTAQVKIALGKEGGRFLAPEDARALIREKAREAVGKCREIKPLKFEAPVTMRVVRSDLTFPMGSNKPYFTIVGDHCYEVTGGSVEEAYWRAC